MKSCRQFKKLFSDYLEGQLNHQLLNDLEQHLRECPQCLAIIQRMKALKGRLAKVAPVTTSSDFETVLHARMRIESGLERSKWYERNLGWSVRIPIYATSLAVLILAMVLINSEMNKSRSTTFSRPLSSAVPDSHFANTKGGTEIYELESYPIKDLAKPLKEPRLQASKTDTGATKDPGVPLPKNTLTERKVMPASYTF